jgi:5-methyltetrahydropteroyltriglutamate--homocysteine methyltransferase
MSDCLFCGIAQGAIPATIVLETPEVVAARIRKALKHIKPEQVILAPDCGMKYLPREVADGKLKAMVEAAQLLRDEYANH